MDNKVKNFFSKLNFFGGGSSLSAVGVDIGSSAIKVVEIKKRGGKAVLETYGSISLGPYAGVEVGRVTNLETEKIIEALKEVLKQSGVTTTSGAVSIPVQSSLIFVIELPPVEIKDGEMASIVSTEARKYVPVPITEVSLDWFILPQKEFSFEEANNPDLPALPIEKIKVLVIATQNDAVSKYRTIARECALDVGFFEIEIFSSIRANFEHELSPVLLMDLGASHTKLSIVEFGMVHNYHTINRGGADISASISQTLSISFPEAEKMKKEFGLFSNPNEKNLSDIIKTHFDYIFAEANKVLLGYEKRYNRTISKVILTGGGSLMKGVKEMAESNFRVEIEFGNPFSKVEAPLFLGKVLETMGPEFAVSLGLALRKLQ